MKLWALALLAAAVGCADKKVNDRVENTTPQEPATKPAAPTVRDGVYRCEIWEGTPFVCLVETKGGTQTLHKIHGTHRVKGAITPTEKGFRFVGVYASNYPYKWKEIDVELARTGPDAYRGVIDTIVYEQGETGEKKSEPETLTMSFESEAYGGKTYGAFFDKAALEKEAAEIEADMAHPEE